MPVEHVYHNTACISHTDAQIKPAEVNQHTVSVLSSSNPSQSLKAYEKVYENSCKNEPYCFNLKSHLHHWDKTF